MDPGTLRILLAEDRSYVRLQIEVPGFTPLWVEMAEPEVMEVIEELADMRATMPDPVAEAVDPNARLRLEADPRWSVAAAEGENALGETVKRALLMLRHSGTGWTGYALKPGDARTLAAQLLAAADACEGIK